MPQHLQPVIRSLEEARENAGLIIAIDSVGVTARKAEESVGTKVKPVPKIVINAHGTQYFPS